MPVQVLNDQEVTKTVRRKRAEGMAVLGQIFHETAQILVEEYVKASKEEVSSGYSVFFLFFPPQTALQGVCPSLASSCLNDQLETSDNQRQSHPAVAEAKVGKGQDGRSYAAGGREETCS